MQLVTLLFQLALNGILLRCVDLLIYSNNGIVSYICCFWQLVELRVLINWWATI